MSPPGWRELQQGVGGARARSPLRAQAGELAGYSPLIQSEGTDSDLSFSPEAQDTLSWLLHRDNEANALWVLKKVYSGRPDLWRKASTREEYHAKSSIMGGGIGPRSSIMGGQIQLGKDGFMARDFSMGSSSMGWDEAAPVLMFNDDVFIVDEEEGAVYIKVLRVGDTSKRSEVNYFTKDGSAKAGETFVGINGRLVFEPGETLRTIEITLIPNEVWDTILEFKLFLSLDEVVNGIVDRFMNEANIKVFNDDPFPTNAYRQILLDGKSESVPKTTLVRAYLSIAWRHTLISRRSIQIIVVEQLKNLQYLGSLLMNIYMLDTVLNLDAPRAELFCRSHHYTLFLAVLVRLIPFLSLHIFEHLTPGLTGSTMGTLQCSLVRLYMYCTDSCRANLGYTGLMVAMNEDAEKVARDIYNTALCTLQHAGKLVMMIAFQFLASWIFEKPLHYFPFIVMFIFPVAIVVFLSYRHKITSQTQTDYSQAHVSLCRCVDQICSNFQMITTYGKEYVVEEDLEHRVKERNKALGVAAKVAFNNNMFAQWVSNIIVATYVVYGGLLVIEGHISVGYWVTNLGIFGNMGDIWATLYEDLATIQKAVPALTRIANFLNMPVDLLEIQEVKERGMVSANGIDVDMMPIEVKGFQAYLTSKPSTEKSLFIEQGQLIAITSPRACGKTTLLRLIGGVLLPPTGDDIYLAMPSHLRVLFVGSAPLFFRGTLISNLIFGLKEDDPDANLERLLEMCKFFGLTGTVLEKVEDGTASPNWMATLSESTSHLLNVVRALMAIPDVLCIERPTIKLDDTTVERVLDTFRDFVQQRGLLCSFPAECRRPRTVIYTTERLKAAEFADTCLNVDRQGVVSHVPKGRLTSQMML